jgi:hypothetical protein
VDRLIELLSILIRCSQRAEAEGNSNPVLMAKLRAWRVKWRKAKRADPAEAARQAGTALDDWRLMIMPSIERLRRGDEVA